jgi:hypothetical protein
MGTSRVSPHAVHATVQVCRRLRRVCGSIARMRVAPPHFSHGGPASIFEWPGAQVMLQRCGTNENLGLIQSMNVVGIYTYPMMCGERLLKSGFHCHAQIYASARPCC